MRLPGKGGMLCMNFNQDFSRLSVGTTQGYRAYSLAPRFSKLYGRKGDGTHIVEMLFNTSLVAHVGAGDGAASSQRCLRILNTKREKEIIRMNYPTAILAVRLNRKRLVVVLETTIYIYDMATMHLAHTIASTPANPRGVIALASCHSPGRDLDPAEVHVAYPGDKPGSVFVYDALNLRAVTVVEAHASAVTCLALSNSGDKLATASEKGTVFRVFSCPMGEKLYEFRRGFKTNAVIYSMAFNLDARFLCVSSDKQTVHVFKLEAPKETVAEGWGGYLFNAASSAATYLPSTMTEMWTQSRSFAQVTLPEAGHHNMAAVIGSGADFSIYVASGAGYLYKYRMDAEVGGECTKEAQHSLVDAAPASRLDADVAGPGRGAGVEATAATPPPPEEPDFDLA